MDRQVFRIGDLVAHTYYPERVLGKITRFCEGGRAMIVDEHGARSYAPKNLVLYTPKPNSAQPITN